MSDHWIALAALIVSGLALPFVIMAGYSGWVALRDRSARGRVTLFLFDPKTHAAPLVGVVTLTAEVINLNRDRNVLIRPRWQGNTKGRPSVSLDQESQHGMLTSRTLVHTAGEIRGNLPGATKVRVLAEAREWRRPVRSNWVELPPHDHV